MKKKKKKKKQTKKKQTYVSEFLSENSVLVVKLSTYLNRRVFVMQRIQSNGTDIVQSLMGNKWTTIFIFFINIQPLY